jgi:hypothetical protein
MVGATVVDNFNNGSITNIDGRFELKIKTSANKLSINISFIGYKAINLELKLNKKAINTGRHFLELQASEIEEVVIKGRVPVAKVSGDTLAFNASSVKVISHAKGMDIIKKLPGFKVKDDKIETQGEQIKKVLLDGKPFFEDDPKKALNSIPSEMVKSIQLFDDYGEIASFTGYAGGKSVKAINIVTKDEFKNNKYRKLEGGYGTEEKYNMEFNTLIKRLTYDLTFASERNNINKSNQDLSAFTSFEKQLTAKLTGESLETDYKNGEMDIQSFSANFNKDFNETNNMTIDYLFGDKSTDMKQDIVQNYQDKMFYNILDTTKSNSRLHKLKYKHSWNINENSKLILNNSLFFQDGNINNNITKSTVIDSKKVSNSLATTYSYNENINLNSMAIWLHNFETEGRSMTAMSNISYTNDQKDITADLNNFQFELDSQNRIDTVLKTTALNENINTIEKQAQLRISFKEPIKMLSSMNFVAKTSLTTRTIGSDNELFESLNSDLVFEAPNLQTDSKSDFMSNRIEIGYSEYDVNFSVNIGIGYENLVVDNRFYLNKNSDSKKSYHNILPLIYGKYFFSVEETLLFFVRSSTSVPNINYLNPRLDITTPNEYIIGNPKLTPSLNHMCMLRYSNILAESGEYISIYSIFKYAHDMVGQSTEIVKEDRYINSKLIEKGSRLTNFENFDGFMNIVGGIDFSTPIDLLKSNLNMGGKYNLYKIPSEIDATRINAYNHVYDANIALVSNISKNVDFSLKSESLINHTSNSENYNNTDFLKQSFIAELKAKTFWDIYIGVDYTFSHYNYFDEHNNTNIHLLNLEISQFYFDNILELKFQAKDVFNQNKGIEFNFHETYNESVKSNVLPQYFMLNLAVRF